jgi:hypothetical protein
MSCLYCDGDGYLETTEMFEYVPCKFCSTESALQRTTPESVSDRAVLRPPTPEGGAGGR